MFVYIGDQPGWGYKMYPGDFPNAWKVNFDKSLLNKDGLYFAVEANLVKPHNSRKYEIIKRDKLEIILEDTLQALYFRDLMYRGVIPASRKNLEHAAEKIPQLLNLENQRFRVKT